MSYFTRRNIITALVIILLVINVATLLTFIFHPHFMFHTGESYSCQKNDPREFIKKELNLDEQQCSKFDQLHKKLADTLTILAKRMHEDRNTITMEMMKVSPDSSMLFRTVDDMGAVFTSIRKLNILHYWQLKSICNEAQKQKLDTVFKGMFCCGENGMSRCINQPGKAGYMRDKHEKGCRYKNEDKDSRF